MNFMFVTVGLISVLVEISFLEEFARIMGPLTKALNILQAETNVQMG